MPPGTYVAWLSTSSVDAIDRIDDRPYFRLDSKLVALNKEDLTDGSILNPIQIDENFDTVPSDTEVWTGTLADGLRDNGNNCVNWTDDNTPPTDPPTVGTYGFAGSINAQWTNTGDPSPCDEEEHRLYCFQIFSSPIVR